MQVEKGMRNKEILTKIWRVEQIDKIMASFDSGWCP